MNGNLLKIVLICIMSGWTMTGRAEILNIGEISQVGIEQFVEILDGVDGFIFVGVGEQRDIARTLGRENDKSVVAGNMDQTDVQELNWTTLNRDICNVDEFGMIEGKSYGETIIQGISDDGKTNLGYVVFVCPKITIYSPEGAVYSYHKIFNQATNVQFTHSKYYVINCVTRDGRDLTKLLDEEKETFDAATGWYTSTEPINSDTEFRVTMEARQDNNDNIVSDSNLSITVEGNNMVFNPANEVSGKSITVKDIFDNLIYNGTISNGKLTIQDINKGILYVSIPGDNVYKVLVY